MFYWPMIDLLLWGITSLFIRSLDPGFSQFLVMIVSGLIFWQAVWRGQIEVTVGILEEFWNKNLINLFATPLKFSEWILSFIVLGLLKLAVSFLFVSGMAYLMYKVDILTFGIYLVPFIISLVISGWWIGMIVGSMIIRYGSRVQALAWTFGFAISPFSAIYYPVSILPLWAQKVAWLFPTSHIFEGMRSVITTGRMETGELVISFGLNLVYLLIAIGLLNLSFKKVLKKGLVKVY
jgi:ABC-2 type transport system permease protein